ncbi:hypothetical protein ACSBR1_023649 [Camellia fascicularis]
MITNDSDSDDELEISMVVAMEEERLKRQSSSHRSYIQGYKFIRRDSSQGRGRFFSTILPNHQYILPIYFGGDFVCVALFFSKFKWH